MAYSWKPEDVLHLLCVSFNPYKTDQKIECPVCGEKQFQFNLVKGCGRCFAPKCGFSGDSAKYYAVKEGLSLSEARRTIEERLGIRTYQGKYSDESKEVFKKRTVLKEQKQYDIAAPEIRHATYSAFLGELILLEKHFKSLIARGFSLDDIEALGYKSVPLKDKETVKSICRRLITLGFTLKGVPGFYVDDNGDWCFVCLPSGIFIPQVNENNLIIGLQVRVDDDQRLNKKTGEIMSKCFWFSSSNYNQGTGAKTSVHVSSDFIYNKELHMFEPVLHGDTVTLTEGGMKADLTRCLLDSRITMIAVQGVHALNPLKEALEKLKNYGLKKVNLAYDMDFLTNPNVKDAMDNTEKIIRELGLELENVMNWESEVIVEGEKYVLKGIDDYLAYQFKKILPKIQSS